MDEASLPKDNNPKWFLTTLLIVLVAVAFWGLAGLDKSSPSHSSTNNPSTNTTSPIVSTSPTNNRSPASIGTRIKTSGCQATGALPDKDCTPGAILAASTKNQICQTGYSASVRNVSTTTKNEVYAEYGIASHLTGEYEVDHLIPLEVGGSNDISNLWPEAAQPTPGFHEKDKVENYLHAQVCSGRLALDQAQNEVADNWLTIYQRAIGAGSY